MTDRFKFPEDQIGKVPCNGCRLCCQKRDAVRVLPDEDPTRWRVQPHPDPRMDGHWILQWKPNGDCIYLGEKGCTTYHDRPQMCGDMDCRILAHRVSFTAARKHPYLNIAVFNRGVELLRKLKKEIKNANR